MTQVKTQPWIHSWPGDFFCLHSFPIVFTILALLGWPPFNRGGELLLGQMLFAVLIIDWAHIFAQWHRIFSNPLEKTFTKSLYFGSYILLIPLVTVVLHFGYFQQIRTFLVYFVIFHFIKQSYGFIKIYSRIDGVKGDVESSVENLLIYLCMWTPAIYWHISFPKSTFTWPVFFIKHPAMEYLFFSLLFLYSVVFILYLRNEFLRWQEKGIFNIPKNVALASAAIGWGAVSLLSEHSVLIMFTVVLTHDLSYTFFVWFTGRRDEKLLKGQVRWLSWWSMPGLVFYILVIILISHPIMVMHLEMSQNKDVDYWLFGTLFNGLPNENSWWQNLGWALFFATQGHHYFIDRYLWKKEKDLAYLVSRGEFIINPRGQL